MNRFFFLCLLLIPGFLCGPAGLARPPLQEQIYDARDKVLPALVHIQPISEVYAGGKKQKTTSVGSGVIISDEGHVVTNYHVVGRVRELLCTLYDKERVSAELVGVDPLTDIAVIQLATAARRNLPPAARLGHSADLEVGEYVMALGSPLALSRSVSLGVVSCADRYFSDSMTLPTGEPTGRFNTWIQTDAAINPGNSGGPLINLDGEVVGINARMAYFGENVGFAIPIDVVRDVVEALIDHGRVARSWIGIDVQPLEEVRKHFGDGEDGALINNVMPASPAARAGVRPGDLLLALDGEPVSARFAEQVPRILKQIADVPVGDVLQLELQRDAETFAVAVPTLDLGKSISDEFECTAWGITVKELTRTLRRALNLRGATRGVLVTSVGPSLEPETQPLPGDVIQQVGEQPVETLDELQAAYEAALETQPEHVLLHVRRMASTRLVLLNPNYGRMHEQDEPLAP